MWYIICVFCQFGIFEVIPVRSSLISAKNEMDRLRDCMNVCDGNSSWSSWNDWSQCREGKCHMETGKQNRFRLCQYLFVPPPARGDIRSRRNGYWRVKCRQSEEKSCVDESTCTGTWGKWGSWTTCSSTSVNGTCQRSRTRHCLDSTQTRVFNYHCIGGLDSDVTTEDCSRESCTLAARVLKPNASKVPSGKSAVETSNNRKPKKKVNQHTLLILAVSLGGVVFGTVFIIVLINVIRRSSNPRDSELSGRRNHWKRMGSTNTSSYVAASEILSSNRVEFSDIRSPSSMTVTSGASSSSSSHQYSFGRNDSVFLRNTGDANDTTLAAHVPKPRRSRLMQENVYWEISDLSMSRNTQYVEETLITGDLQDQQNREEVANVLYDADA